jgi:hypothetical protein
VFGILDVREQEGHILGVLLQQLYRFVTVGSLVEAETRFLKNVAGVHEDQRIVVNFASVYKRLKLSPLSCSSNVMTLSTAPFALVIEAAMLSRQAITATSAVAAYRSAA